MWWQSIRSRLVFGSVSLSLFATSLLALTAILAVFYYYGVDQKARMRLQASERARSISTYYARENFNFGKAVQDEFPSSSTQSEFMYIVLTLSKPTDTQATSTLRVIYPAIASNQGNEILKYLIRLSDETVQQKDISRLGQEVRQAMRGTPTEGDFETVGPFGFAPSYYVQPVTVVNAGGKSSVMGVLVVTPRSAAIPPFVFTVGTTVGMAALFVAALAALVAIAFSRTITRPLARLTGAAHKLGAGDYKVQVQEQAPGELGELARTFNEMAEQLRQDMEELRRQESWRRELIMSITHDLATPLTAIAGLGEALADGVKQSREEYAATGRIITHETLRLRRLVNDLHVMAKVEAGALYPHIKDVRLAGLVDEVLAVLATEFERARIEPLNNISYSLPMVAIDPDMITRVLSNLCDNALRHTPQGGSVTIEAREDGGKLLVSVIDSGEGIPEAALSQIFERFYRVDSARQSSTGGSGLGLAIVQAMVEAHDGRVWAENVPGAGARINFTLPVSLKAHAREKPTNA
jgi:signal transduction histidine kinase